MSLSSLVFASLGESLSLQPPEQFLFCLPVGHSPLHEGKDQFIHELIQLREPPCNFLLVHSTLRRIPAVRYVTIACHFCEKRESLNNRSYKLDVPEVALQPVDPDKCVGVTFHAYQDLEPTEAARRTLIREIVEKMESPTEAAVPARQDIRGGRSRWAVREKSEDRDSFVFPINPKLSSVWHLKVRSSSD